MAAAVRLRVDDVYFGGGCGNRTHISTRTHGISPQAPSRLDDALPLLLDGHLLRGRYRCFCKLQILL